MLVRGILALVLSLTVYLFVGGSAAADLPRPPPAKPEAQQIQQSALSDILPPDLEAHDALEGTLAPQGPKADYILVNKSDRSLKLFSKGKEIAELPIQLGRQPVGHKLHEGDSRTPEGIYYIDWRNPESNYFRSLRISYPNSEDRARAQAAGLNPGSMIMIHGLPNDPDYRREVMDQQDWTDGCIALSDGDMLLVWDLVEVGTPIEIRP